MLVFVFLCESTWSGAYEFGFGTASKCDHSTLILGCRLRVVLCVCDI